MSNFSSFERRLSGIFGPRFPLKPALKWIYQAINFTLHREPGFRWSLAEAVRIWTPSQMIEWDEPEQDVAEFFGYFDASPWSPDKKSYVVNHARAPQQTEIVVYDFVLRRRVVIGETCASTWQQGAMPRWLIKDDKLHVAFNGLQDRVLGTHLWCKDDSSQTFLPLPLQAINERFNRIYSINYLRLAHNRTEYGYPLEADNLHPGLPPTEDGVWGIDLQTNKQALLVSLADLIAVNPSPDFEHAIHEVNHISVAPDGLHFVFIHRYRSSSEQHSRLFVASHDGSKLQPLLVDGSVSHFTWLSSRSLLAWARIPKLGAGYYVIQLDPYEVTRLSSAVLDRWGDGHPTCHPARQWIVTDSYPDRRRQQHLMLLRCSDQTPIDIGRFLLPMKFFGAKRIDLHPRWSPDGTMISIDAGHMGVRRNYILDLGKVLSSFDPMMH